MRCPKCFGRIYSDETPVGHELSGRCRTRTTSKSVKTVSKPAKKTLKKTPPAPIPKKVVECGTRAMYQRGCRCEPCKAAQLAWSRAYRARTKDHYDEYRSEWLKNNADKVAEYRRKDKESRRRHRALQT